MFDFHIHSKVSFDSECPAKDIVKAAESAGLREICFTDHYDFNDDPEGNRDLFTKEQYESEYGALFSDKLKIRRGVEFGLTPWNQKELDDLTQKIPFDFIIGSVHYVGGYDPYFKDFWIHNGMDTAFEKYLLGTLECVKSHDKFDVLGHINYVCKSAHNPTKKALRYEDYSDICDEIMRTLAQNGKGMEINTSGCDRVGEFLPAKTFIKRFRELGGEIITVGSDAHDATRVGQYIDGALEIARDAFGYVCTFEGRKAVYHKI